MAERDDPPPSEREKRLAQALRANLRRRKPAPAPKPPPTAKLAPTEMAVEAT